MMKTKLKTLENAGTVPKQYDLMVKHNATLKINIPLKYVNGIKLMIQLNYLHESHR